MNKRRRLYTNKCKMLCKKQIRNLLKISSDDSFGGTINIIPWLTFAKTRKWILIAIIFNVNEG